jgi:predicted O-linked N-acetylglucosamine transferase (SPINDLY family)
MKSVLKTDDEIAQLFATNHYASAEEASLTRIQKDPNDAVAWMMIGMVAEQRSLHEEAEAAFRSAVCLAPESAAAWSSLGRSLVAQGQVSLGLKIAFKGIELDVLDEQNHKYVIDVLEKARDNDEIDSYKCLLLRGLQDHPRASFLHFVLAKLSYWVGDHDKATSHFLMALGSVDKASKAEVLKSFASFLCAIGRLNDAAQAFAELTEMLPDEEFAWIGFGACQQLAERFDIAVESYERALEINPSNLSAKQNLATVLYRLNKYKEAVQLLESVMESMTEYAEPQAAHPALTKVMCQNEFYKRHMADWSSHQQFGELSEISLHIKELSAKFSPTPFQVMPLIDCPETNLALGSKCGVDEEPLVNVPLIPAETKGKIKVAWLGADFHDHATMFLLMGLFREYDKAAFEFFVYSYGPKEESSYRSRLITSVDGFYDVSDSSYDEIKKLAREHSIDIAIDLKGFTGGTRTSVFSQRLAPLQIQYLGYPGSSGKSYFDYLVADEIVIPRELRHHYSENIMFMPKSYQPNDSDRQKSGVITRREDWGLPRDGLVFAAFHQIYKIGPEEFETWVEVLQGFPGAVLWLLCDNEEARLNLTQHAMDFGLNENQLVFAQKVPVDIHLERLSHADAYLDCFNVNGHTSVSDALFSGVPVVTKPGRQFASRVGASLVCAVGWPQLVAKSKEDYVDIARRVVVDPEYCKPVKGLAEPGGLYDSYSYTRAFEDLLKQAHSSSVSGRGLTDLYTRYG